MVERPNLNFLKKSAKDLKRQLASEDVGALERFKQVFGDQDKKHSIANCLHVIAHEEGYESWARLKIAIEAKMMTREERVEVLTRAIFNGQFYIIEKMLELDPTLGDEHFGMQAALCKRDIVLARLEKDPSLATQKFGVRSALLHLSFSKYFQKYPDKVADMLVIAERLIEAGADVNDSYLWGDGSPLSALYGALGHANNLKLAELLLKHGANPNDGESLYHATELGHLDGVRLLIRYGVDIGANYHWIRMLDFDNYEGAKLLLESGADANQKRDDGSSFSTLHHAIKRGRDGRFGELLIEHGADGSLVENGHTPYGYAYIHNNKSMIEVLKRSGYATPISQEEEFFAAVMRGDGDTATKIAEEVPDILSRLHEMDLTLVPDLAARPGNLEVFEVLRKVGVDLRQLQNEYGSTPLHAAVWNGRAEELAYFLKFEPDLEWQNMYGGTALGTAIHGSLHCPNRQEGDYIACVQLLLEAGAKIRPDHNHLTMGSEEVCDYLQGL